MDTFISLFASLSRFIAPEVPAYPVEKKVCFLIGLKEIFVQFKCMQCDYGTDRKSDLMKHGMTHLPKLFCATCNVPVARSSQTKHNKTIGHLRRLDIITAEAGSSNLRKEILELESTFQRLTIINRKGKERMV